MPMLCLRLEETHPSHVHFWPICLHNLLKLRELDVLATNVLNPPLDLQFH
jgi:hypothetical protein